MNTDDNKTIGNSEAKQQQRDDLLSELESIRNLLTENSAKDVYKRQVQQHRRQ